MIKNINEIVNFRFAKRFKSWNYPTKTNLKLLDNYPLVFYYFNLVIWDDFIKEFNKNKTTILCYPTKLIYLIKNIDLLTKNNKIDKLIIAGADINLSNVKSDINILLNFFNEIYFEAKDIYYKNIKTIPMGLNYAYTLRNGGDENILNLINKKNHIKDKLITTAFGDKWPQLNDIIDDRKNLINFCKKTKWLVKNNWDPLDYYKNLSEYKYFICPIGNGIQSPKIFEALLVKTIPIVINTPCVHDLKNYGYPILIINNYDELETKKLEKDYKLFYNSINWENILYSLTIKGFVEKFNF